MKSIKIKLVILYLALVFIVMIVSGMYIYINVKKQEASKIELDLKRYAKIIDEQIIQEYKVPEKFCKELNKQRLLFGARSDIQISILDIRGNVLISDEKINDKNHVIISAILGKESFEPWAKGIDNKNEIGRIKLWMNYAIPTKVNDISYIIYLKMDASSAQERINNITNIILISSIIAMFFAIIIGILFANTLTEPIYILTKMAKEISQGNLNQQIPVFSNDEIGQLIETFNNMGKSLYKIMNDMSADKNRIEIILNNTTDGVLAFDNSGKIVHTNKASKEILEVLNIENISLKEVSKILDIEISSIEDIKKEKIINIKDKYVNLLYTSYKNNIGHIEGIVIVLQDITKYRKLDNMRKEFVANVSHEIRTPLTTIKTYVETLLDTEVDKKTKNLFLNTINLEVDRMTHLTSDLLELSHYDNKQLNLNIKDTNLIFIINNSIKQSLVLLEKKNQNIIFKNNIKDMYIKCDQYKINQVFINIISNAIKYSKEFSNIIIRTKEEENYYLVFIEDSGIGIPKEDIKHIFERFYRVDKARSRSMGGTGLGLSIVKEIMNIHKAKIFVKSEFKKGTTIILKFNKINNVT